MAPDALTPARRNGRHVAIGASGKALIVALALLLAAGMAKAVTLSVIYKRSTDTSAPRSHGAAMAALQALENELTGADFELQQPSQAVYDRIGDAPGMIVTFARDAGYAVLVDSQLQTRPYDGTDMQLAAVTVKARITHGNRIVASLSQYAQIPYKKGAIEARAFDLAAEKAAKALSHGIADRVQRYQQRLDNGALADTEAAEPALAPGATAPPLPPVDAPVARRWALLIGVADFQKVREINGVKAADLPAVRNDLRQLRQTLLELGYRPEDIIVLQDAGATTAAVKAALDQLAAQTRPDDQVFVFLGSHGAPRDGAWSDFGVPLLYDTNLRQGEVFDFERFKSALKRLPARRVIWANDTCHSGGALSNEPVVMISSRSFVVVPRTGFDQAMAAANAGKHLAVFASSRDSQVSFNTASNEYGLFSSMFTAALNVTGGRMAARDLYKNHLESQLPDAARQLPCTPAAESCPRTQQPGFAFAGGGDQLSLK